jgi:hypothetical protein
MEQAQQKYKTLLEYLKAIANTNVCDQADENYMTYILKYILGFSNVTVVAGTVYGLSQEPADIHTTAKMMLKALVNSGRLTEADVND